MQTMPSSFRKFKKDNIIKEFLRKGGIRCEILNDSEKFLLPIR